MRALTVCLVLVAWMLAGCGSGESCTVADNGDGTSTITCPDGTSTSVGGDDSCTIADNGDGTSTIDCDDGTTVTVGGDGTCTIEDNGDGTSTITCDDGTEVTVGDDDSCTVTDNGDGTSTITCDDGTDVTVGDDDSCTVTDNPDGTSTITCSDGTSVTVGDDDSCTIDDNGDGTATIRCDDGTVVTVGDTSCTIVHNGDGTATIFCDDGTNVTVETSVIVFYESAEQPGGNLGDRATTEAICRAAQGPLHCPNGVQALLSYSGGDDALSMPATYGVPTNLPIHSLSGVRIADNWADLFDGDGITSSLADAGVTGPTVFYAGTNFDGTTSADNCDDWTVDTGAAQFDAGYPNGTNHYWINAPASPYSCALDTRLVCTCY